MTASRNRKTRAQIQGRPALTGIDIPKGAFADLRETEMPAAIDLSRRSFEEAGQ